MKEIKRFFIGFRTGLKLPGQKIGLVINSILLLIVYIIGVGLTSITAKLFGKHFLDTKLSKNKTTYWSELNLKKKSIEDYYRQF